MAKVEICGFPDRAKQHNILINLQRVLTKDGITKFWLRELSDIRGQDTRMAVLEFESSHDANRAQRRLDGFVYISREGDRFPLTANTEDKRKKISQSPRREVRKHGNFQGVPNDRRYSRSRSPVQRRQQYHGETSKLDMELELLRKQRLVIEEERRLLVERKKLELIKDLDRTDLAELDRTDGRETPDTDGRHPKENVSDKHSPRAEKPVKPAKSKPQKQLPLVLPYKKILLEMEDLITSASSSEDMSKHVRTKTRAIVRRRLKEALQKNKEPMPTNEMIALYRNLYPATTDEMLVKKIVKESKFAKKRQVKVCGKPGRTDVNLPEDSKGDYIAEYEIEKNEINEMNYDTHSVDGAMSLMYDGDSNSDWIDSDL